jgi:hypothetical protein
MSPTPDVSALCDPHKIARCVRGCTTDAQYQELTANIEDALISARADAKPGNANRSTANASVAMQPWARPAARRTGVLNRLLP